jgi:hypothetical protein
LQKNLSAKNTTQLVRIAYTSLVAYGVRAGAAPALADALRPALLLAVDRAAQQPLQVGSPLHARIFHLLYFKKLTLEASILTTENIIYANRMLFMLGFNPTRVKTSS